VGAAKTRSGTAVRQAIWRYLTQVRDPSWPHDLTTTVDGSGGVYPVDISTLARTRHVVKAADDGLGVPPFVHFTKPHRLTITPKDDSGRLVGRNDDMYVVAQDGGFVIVEGRSIAERVVAVIDYRSVPQPVTVTGQVTGSAWAVAADSVGVSETVAVEIEPPAQESLDSLRHKGRMFLARLRAAEGLPEPGSLVPEYILWNARILFGGDYLTQEEKWHFGEINGMATYNNQWHRPRLIPRELVAEAQGRTEILDEVARSREQGGSDA
jgi:hypothetical protein